MYRTGSRWLLVLAGTLVFLPQALAAESRLVSVDSLKQILGRSDVRVIDASPPKLHAAGHIPGAINVDLFGFGAREAPPSEMQRRIQSWGIDPDTKVVLYDQGGTYFATSVFFDLYYHGIPAENLHVLDGGMAKWRATGGAVTKESTPAPKAGTFRIGKPREEARVRLPEFLVASGDPAKHALVEAMEPEMHFGAHKFFDRAGHIPNAIMAPADAFFNADRTFKSPAELRRMLAYLGIRPEQTLHAHCGGGIAASVPFFAAKFLAGYPSVKLYKESQLEWLRDDRGLPMWTYDAPNLLRDRLWVSGWGGAMLRSFGVSNLSLIDIRPATAFQQARLPFAVNIPAETFRLHANAPEKLAEALAAAGVDPAHEAVIVSEGGLNPDSALAFALLETLGQKRVSLLLGSVDDWALAGLPLGKDGETAMLKRTSYAAAPHASRAGSGLYPTVHLASGKALPTRLPEGKVAQVPYTSLVNADGTPKAAKDLWEILTKAGVPRYAELVAIADDPGEAAMGYFVLKLMGYPDVRMRAP